MTTKLLLTAMGATRWILLILMLPLPALAQVPEASVAIENESIVNTLKHLESIYQVFFSYDPTVVVKQGNVTLNAEKASLEEVLRKILPSYLAYTIVGEHVAITTKERPIGGSDRKAQPNTTRSNGVRDTAVFETIVTRVDTHWVTKTIYDTVVVKKTMTVYDTVHVITAGLVDNNGTSAKDSPERTRAEILFAILHSRQEASYRGGGLGMSTAFRAKRLTVSAGLSYEYLFQNTTVGTHYDSAGTPDTTKLNVERMNTRALILARIGAGFMREWSRFTTGVETGLSFYHMLDVNEKRVMNRELNLIGRQDFRPVIMNVYVTIPLRFRFNNCRYVSLAPFLEYGINRELKRGDRAERYSCGLRIGLGIN